MWLFQKMRSYFHGKVTFCCGQTPCFVNIRILNQDAKIPCVLQLCTVHLSNGIGQGTFLVECVCREGELGRYLW